MYSCPSQPAPLFNLLIIDYFQETAPEAPHTREQELVPEGPDESSPAL
jgi:hypothetical protein